MMREVIQVNQKLPFAQGFPLSLQHLFAMFGANILVPILLGIDPAVVLLFNGVGTLLYMIITKKMIPAYLGASFAFIACGQLVISQYGYADALGGFIAVGIVFCIVAVIIAKIGYQWVYAVLPPAAIGAVIAVIGLGLGPTAAKMAGLSAEAIDPVTVSISMVTLGVTIAGYVFFKGFLSIIPILIGIITGYLYAVLMGRVDFSIVAAAPWFSLPTFTTPVYNPAAIAIILPVVFVVIAEHIGDLIVIGSVVGNDMLKNPGLHRSFFGNGLSMILSGCFGSTPNTTYSENVGVLAITRVFSVYVVAGAAALSVLLSFLGKFAALIRTVPEAVIGGVSLLLFGVIATSGIRTLMEQKIDYSKPVNLVLTSVVLIIGVSGARISVGGVVFEGMALAALFAVVLGLIFKLFKKI
ncbi:MAG: uracil permease [Alphaproteobacteria bacterium]|nr:uracil permease [Alphaproteobacteria bacterium]